MRERLRSYNIRDNNKNSRPELIIIINRHERRKKNGPVEAHLR